MKKIAKIFVNLLTISRIIFSIYLIFNAYKLSDIIFLILILVLFLTDHFDGFLARRLHVQTLFGAYIDTLADKILCITLIIPFLINAPFKNLSYLLLIGEISIFLVNMIATLKHKKTTVSLIGKAKMWVLSISIILGYISKFGYLDSIIFNIFVVVTFIVQIFVVINYIKYMKNQKNIKSKNEYKKDIKNMFNTDYYLNM